MAAAFSQGSQNQAHSSRRKIQVFCGVGMEQLSTPPWQHSIPIPTRGGPGDPTSQALAQGSHLALPGSLLALCSLF